MADDEDDCFRSEEDLSRKLSQHDPDRMVLTRTEHQHALAIKQLIEGTPDIDNLSDFMYAQLAIICKDNTEDVLYRCQGMQGFREEYNIVDTTEQGCRYIKHCFDLLPLELLSFEFSEKDGVYVFVHDYAKFDPRVFTSPQMKEDWLRGMYYNTLLFFPDFESVRRGGICVNECENMEPKREILKCFSQLFSEFLTYYPFIGICHFYHTGTMVNILASILRKLLPKEVAERFQVGFQFDGHLGEALLVPTVEEANKRARTNMESALALRYENEKYFVLLPMPEEEEEEDE